MNKIIAKAEEFALSEIERYGLPSKINFETSNKKGKELAKKLNVDVDIVQIGTRLMDLKLGESSQPGKNKDHVGLGVDAAKQFLAQFNLSSDTEHKILNCIEGHHDPSKWVCPEAEVAANADCYRFLLIRNWEIFLYSCRERGWDFEKALDFAEKKAKEKWGILSLDICKEELQPHYTLIQEIIAKSRTGA